MRQLRTRKRPRIEEEAILQTGDSLLSVSGRRMEALSLKAFSGCHPKGQKVFPFFNGGPHPYTLLFLTEAYPVSNLRLGVIPVGTRFL